MSLPDVPTPAVDVPRQWPRVWLPFLRWWPMPRSRARADLLAGVTVALVLIPQSMAYAQLAGLPAHYGLYAAFLPGIVAAAWGSSAQLATGPVAVVSLLTAAALTPIAAQGGPEYVALAILLALLVGVIQLLLGLFRLGVVVNFLSHPVVVGFTNAAALIIGLSQLNKLFGVPAPNAASFLEGLWQVLASVPDLHLPTLAMGVLGLGVMIGLRRHRPRWPGVLVAVVVTTVLSWLFDFETHGGRVVGAIPAGLPDFALPQLKWDQVLALLPTALTISVVGFVEAVSIAKAMATRTRAAFDANQELRGQGLANLVSSLSQGYPVSGSFSRTAVNYNAGARTGLSSVFAGLVVLVTLLVLTPLLHHLPQAVLAGVIMMAVVGLINFGAMVHAWRAHRHDGWATVAAFVATLLFAPNLEFGILVGIGLAVGLYLYRTMRPVVTILGRHPDGSLQDATALGLPTDPRLVAIRFDGPLYFANVSWFEDTILEALARSPEAKYLLVMGNGINQIDASGEEVIRHLVPRLRENGVTLAISGLNLPVLEVLERTGMAAEIGADNLFTRADAALEAIYQRLGETSFDPELAPLRPATP